MRESGARVGARARRARARPDAITAWTPQQRPAAVAPRRPQRGAAARPGAAPLGGLLRRRRVAAPAPPRARPGDGGGDGDGAAAGGGGGNTDWDAAWTRYQRVRSSGGARTTTRTVLPRMDPSQRLVSHRRGPAGRRGVCPREEARRGSCNRDAPPGRRPACARGIALPQPPPERPPPKRRRPPATFQVQDSIRRDESVLLNLWSSAPFAAGAALVAVAALVSIAAAVGPIPLDDRCTLPWC
jgi:hypothetical protein